MCIKYPALDAQWIFPTEDCTEDCSVKCFMILMIMYVQHDMDWSADCCVSGSWSVWCMQTRTRWSLLCRWVPDIQVRQC